ncbi:MAG: prepilin-type N-terminal cleavage/methylation domain-containing protein [Thermodesulfovibrionales bacterium]|nr:prepilin-type N-terminal cleavage/methylation domain-containing protein [Thermodesulfovibrionales bacterium]
MRLKCNSGFTLLELIITLFLITLIVGLSTVTFLSRQPSEMLNSSVRQIVSTLKYARTLAQSTGEIKVAVFDIDNKTFMIEGKKQNRLPEGANITFNDPLHGITKKGVYRIEFYPSGLTGYANIIIEGYNKTFHINIDPVVGAYVVKQ